MSAVEVCPVCDIAGCHHIRERTGTFAAPVSAGDLDALIDLIGEFGREVYYLLDDCETSGPVGKEVHTITTDGLMKVSDLLDRIDALPFEEPGVILGTGAMLQTALKQSITALRTQKAGRSEGEGEVERLTDALSYMVQAICGDTGFATCVRRDTGMAYPWPALDLAEAKARAALRAAAEPVTGGAMVKPLVWEGFTSGNYRIEVEQGGIARLLYYSAAIFDDEEPEHLMGGYLSLISMDDLKSAAQADHEARILSALQPGDGWQGIEALIARMDVAAIFVDGDDCAGGNLWRELKALLSPASLPQGEETR